MDEHHKNRALGALILALLLAPGLAPRLLPTPDRALPPLEPPSSAAVAAELGWPVACDEGDPAVWSALPGIGAARARALASAARRGAIDQPDDLLRVPGFGIKMAAAVAGRIAWSAGNTSSSTFSHMAEAEQ